MIRRFGIDTSVLVRLVTRDPEVEFEYCVEKLRILVDDRGDEVFVSNQVIGEAYIVVQQHYGVSKVDARASLLDALQSGLVSPLNGSPVIAALEATGGPGLFDRLIANDYTRAGFQVLTLGRKMASLADVDHL